MLIKIGLLLTGIGTIGGVAYALFAGAVSIARVLALGHWWLGIGLLLVASIALGMVLLMIAIVTDQE